MVDFAFSYFVFFLAFAFAFVIVFACAFLSVCVCVYVCVCVLCLCFCFHSWFLFWFLILFFCFCFVLFYVTPFAEHRFRAFTARVRAVCACVRAVFTLVCPRARESMSACARQCSFIVVFFYFVVFMFFIITCIPLLRVSVCCACVLQSTCLCTYVRMKCVRAVSKQTVHGHVCVLTAHVRARQCSFIVVFLYFVLFMFFFILFRCECLCAVRACFSPRACARMCE